MSGGSAANNSWTILASEESVCDTMKPSAEGTEHGVSVENQPASGATSVKGDMVPESKRAEPNGDRSTDSGVRSTDAAVLSSLDASSSFPGDGDALSQSEGLPEGPTQPSTELDSFSDSFTNITPSSAEPAASVLSTETLGRVDLPQEDERLSQEGLHHLNAEGLQEEGLQPDQCQATAGVENQADSTEASEVGEQKAAGEVGPQLRRRRSLLAALEQIGRAEEEEEKEEEFQLPRQQEDSGFSVNKCILAALILLGLGTIFFSGLFMEPDEESGYVTVDPRDEDLPEKQEWLNTEVPQTDAEKTDLVDQLAKGNQQISELQTQLQAQTEELKVAKGLAEEGAKERLHWVEVEKENSRLKTKMASLPVLQKENQRMKKELDSLPALQKELETLRATVTELKLSKAPNELPDKDSTAPPAGQIEDGTQVAAEIRSKDKSPGDDQRGKYKDADTNKKHKGMDEEKEREKSPWKEGGKKKNDYGGKAEWEKGEPEREKISKEKYKGKRIYSEETKLYPKNSARQGDETKPWKDRKDEKRSEEKSGRKERNEEKDWKKAKQLYQGKQLKGQKKDWNGKDDEKHKGSEERKKEKEGYRESSKEKWVKNHQKDKEGKKEWKINREWKNGNEQSKEGKQKSDVQKSRDPQKDGKGWDESKRQSDNEWKSKIDDNDWKKDERKRENDAMSREGKYAKEWKRDNKKPRQPRERGWPKEGMEDRDGSRFQRDPREFPGEREAELQADRKSSHRRPSVKQPEYWQKQRSRLQRNPKPPQHCHSVETCAQSEGLPPVSFQEFQAVLQAYLARAKEVGVDASARGELQKLATEFFKNGLFVHDQMRFQDFVADLGDVLEDMVEGDDDDDEEDSDIEEEMEGFQREVLRKFAAAGGNEGGAKGAWRKESRRGHA